MYDKNKELEIVKQSTGIVGEGRIEIIETGWTSRVYVVDGGKAVFKFPRNEKYRKECKQEVTTLKLLKEYAFGLNVPVLNWISEDNYYFGFSGVLGTPLRLVIDSLDEEQKRGIGTQIGAFLRQLHSIKASDNMKMQTLEEQAMEYQGWYRKGRNLLVDFFSETEIGKIDAFFAEEVPKCMVGTGELVFCHGDLDCNNTLIDSENRVGIIDFGDAGLYDRSQDFRGMEDEIVLDAMMEAYGDEEVINKMAVMATSKMVDVLNLIYYIENNHNDGVDNVGNFLKKVRRALFSS